MHSSPNHVRAAAARALVVLLVASSSIGIGRADQSTPAIPVLDASVSPVSEPMLPGGSMDLVPLEDTGTIDLAALAIAPAAAAQPVNVTIGRGRAEIASAPQVVPPNTTSIVRTIGSNYEPSETIDAYLNGVLVGTFASDTKGRVYINVTTGGGLGFFTLEYVGQTSRRRAGAVFQVANDGFTRGVAFGPHAINPTGTSTLTVYGKGYPNTTVTFARNGTTIGTLAVGASGGFLTEVTVPAGGDQSAVYTVDDGTAGSMAGMTIEERADAGTPPTGDLNIPRGLLDAAVLNSAGGAVALVGEGFLPGEAVTISSCASAVIGAGDDGSIAAFLNYGAATGISHCVMTGASGRVARASVRLHGNVTSVRGMIVEPSTVRPGGAVTALVLRVTPNNTGTYYLDGVSQGTTTTNASGRVAFQVTKPKTGSVHTIGWVAQDGTSDTITVPFLLFANLRYDVDVDGMTDRTVFRPSAGTWYSALSRGGPAVATAWGVSTDVDVLGDYDGDSKADVAVWRPSNGTWYIVQSSNGSVRVDAWGQNGDIPLAGDVDGDHKDDLVIFRPSTGTFYYKRSTGGTATIAWGASGDQPLLADFDLDGHKDAVVFRPSTGVWYVARSTGGTSVVGWGTSGDIAVSGDFDGDAIADPTIYRPGSGQWFVNKSTGGTTVVTWGTATDIPVAGDWDGDGLNDYTIWRPSNGGWFTQYSSGGSAAVVWGTTNDKPTGRAAGT